MNFKCPNCERWFVDKSALEQHLIDSHQMLCSARTARDRPAGMALEDGGWKEVLFQSGQASPQRKLGLVSYDAKQLDLDEGATVTGRRHYTPQELKAIATIERRMREDERPQPKRKKMRVRRRRDSDDDD